MDIDKLYYLIALAKTESFSETAEIMYTTQGNVSKQIAALEKTLDIKLVDRSHRQIVLTKSGKIVLKYAQKIVQEYEDMQRAVKYLKAPAFQISICSIPVMAHYQITGHLSEFRKLHPEITLRIEEQADKEMISFLNSGRFDFAFFRTDLLEDDHLEKKILFRDELTVVLPADHPLAVKSSLSLGELSNESFLFLEPGTSVYTLCVQACQRAGFNPQIIYTGSRMENIIEFVGEGIGISLMMWRALKYLNLEKVVIVPLKEKINSEISLVRLKRDHYPSHHALFWRFISEIDWESH